MPRWTKIALTLLGLSFYVACSDVKFDAKPSSDCKDFNNNFGEGTCEVNPSGYQKFDYSVRMGDVDILFVTDNSGSMFKDQQEMATKFPGFLDSIRGIDYQLAIITTDISASRDNPADEANGNGALWDGKFIEFPNGHKVLKNSNDVNSIHESNIDHFADTIQRPESATCDNSDFRNCPSSDERGIYAANMALDRSENQSFFRNTGHLAIVILSDEDERSTGGEHIGNVKGPALEPYDLPSTLVEKAATQLGQTKTMSVHSIIIQPGDSSCKKSQDDQGNEWVLGQYGDKYHELSNPSTSLIEMGKVGRSSGGSVLMKGTDGSICSGNYTQELGDISDFIKETPLQLPCSPVNGSLMITTTPKITGLTYDLDQNNRVIFSERVVGTNVNLKFECSRTE